MSTAKNKRLLTVFPSIILVVFFSACGWSRTDGGPEFDKDDLSSMPKELCAVLYPPTASFGTSRKSTVSAVIINNGSMEITVNFWNLGQSTLALNVYDSRGKRMLSIGPATPLPQKEMGKYNKVMKPGERIDMKYDLNIFSPELPPGKYSVTMQLIPSNKVYIRIRGGTLTF